MTILRVLVQSLLPGRLKAASPVNDAFSASGMVDSSHMATNDFSAATGEKKVLNVGGNNKTIAIPKFYEGWTHHLLDIDPGGNPDVVCDARTLLDLPGRVYDSVYCSHNLEHYYSHDVVKVLIGFHHVLKNDGFVNIAVPDMQAVMKQVVQADMDIEDVLYQSPAGPITVKDVIYGFGKQIEQSGVEFFAHKTGFSERSLIVVLKRCGFSTVYSALENLEIKVFAFKQPPSEIFLTLLGLPLSLKTSPSPEKTS